ncbi:prepilin-type N-terminal cleavage/methylation domain-containing protein [Candidatus Peregrinibacteria bacterium]|nr:prepilin-type N-terminal cleavage/methylation domain-containing protein [Candidatus Peregrinibacteria bacterium]
MIKTHNKSQVQNAGFTLVELLISISVFMIFLAIAGSSYVTLVSANKSANATQKNYTEVRFVFDELARAVRGGAIDYSCVDGENPCLDNLNLTTQTVFGALSSDGLARTLFKFDAAKHAVLVLHQTRAASQLSIWSAGTFQPLTSENLKVEDLSFFVSPPKDPYASENAGYDKLQLQPAVTISMKVAGTAFRTTYSSRFYGRQSLYENL